MSSLSRQPTAIAWRRIKWAGANAGTTPWDFDSQDLTSAASTMTRSTASPPGLLEGASFLTAACSGADGQNGRARMMISPPSWPSGWRYVRTSFGLYVPTGFSTSVVAGGIIQPWKFDCFPTVNNQVFLLYTQADNTYHLVCKDNNVDTEITPWPGGYWTMSEGVWHRIQIVLKLSTAPTGWARVYLDGQLVGWGDDVKTIYLADDGTGHKLPWVRWGLAAHGVGQTGPTTLSFDDVSLDVAA